VTDGERNFLNGSLKAHDWRKKASIRLAGFIGAFVHEINAPIVGIMANIRQMTEIVADIREFLPARSIKWSTLLFPPKGLLELEVLA